MIKIIISLLDFNMYQVIRSWGPDEVIRNEKRSILSMFLFKYVDLPGLEPGLQSP